MVTNSKNIFPFLCCLVIMMSCSCGTEPKSNKEKIDGSNSNEQLVKDIGLHQVDSLQILFFNMDSSIKDAAKRYQRYYTYINSNDTFLINQIKNSYGGFSVKDSIGEVRSEGKIICLKGAQELKTIYFKYNNNPLHTYFIYNGKFYFFNPDKSFFEKLIALKPLAVEPVSDNP